VVRRDEGGDVVSEGQSYAMLIAAAVGDETRFRTIWTWTKNHMMRADGLLSWRWKDGVVTDLNSAADADLDAARALLVAGKRFGAVAFKDDGKRLAAAILANETVAVGTDNQPGGENGAPVSGVAGLGRLLAAGNWATQAPYVVNPGYFSPRADAELLAATSDARWSDMTRSQRTIGWQLVGPGKLPPDWASVDAAGHAVPTGPVTGGPVQFGLDAARFPIRMAESCEPADRALAGALRPTLDVAGDTPAVRQLDGTPSATWQHPLALVAVAAAELAAGDPDGAAQRLDAAATLEAKYPTYYGAAWVALGRIMLTTSLLGECAVTGAA
jgi:endoglucanase